MKISASIYSNKEKDLETLVRELDAHGMTCSILIALMIGVLRICPHQAISKRLLPAHYHPHPESFFTLIDQYKLTL